MSISKKLFVCTLFCLFGLGNSLHAQDLSITKKDTANYSQLDSIIFYFSSPPVVNQTSYTIIVTKDTVYEIDQSGTIIIELEEELWGDFMPVPSPDTTSSKSEVSIDEIHREAFEIAYDLFGEHRFGYLDLQSCLGGNTYKLIFKHAQKGRKIIAWQCKPPKQHQERIMKFIEMLNQSVED